MASPDTESSIFDLFTGRPFGLLVIGIYGFCALFAGILMLRDFQQLDEVTHAIARERGNALFSLLEIARDWNGMHTAVYVPITPQTQPNPYLDNPRRDVVTKDGTKLTLINPAYMTRQFADIASRKEGVQLHLTSLNLIHPGNAPDPWEIESLKSFETGVKERLSLMTEGSESVFRYMAPLPVKQSCLRCHTGTNYKLGDVRGGISVTMPARELLGLRDEQKRDIWRRYFFAYILIAGLLHLMLFGGRRFIRTIQKINREQEATIEARTRELVDLNVSMSIEIQQKERHQREIRESEARYRAVVENATDGICIDDQGTIIFANERLSSIIGRPVRQIVGSDLLQFVYSTDLGKVRGWRDAVLAGQDVDNPLRVRFRYAELERMVYVDLFGTIIPGVDNLTSRVLMTVRDISNELDGEREAQIAAAVFDSAAEAIMVTGRDGRILRVNPAFTAITGYSDHDVIGQSPRILQSGRHDDAFYAEMLGTLRTTGAWQGEIWNRRKNGEPYLEWLSITQIQGGEDHGGFVSTFTDITKRKEAEELMQHRAHHDALTDLPNRLLFRDRLQSAVSVARRYQRQIGLLYIDLDFFKQVNDSLGHSAGDELLIETAHRLMDAVRDSDTVARLGGDEFAVVLESINGAFEAEEVAQRIVASMQRPFELKEGTASVSASIGVALFPEHGATTEILQKHADLALYEVKEAGRNNYRMYAPLMERP